MNAAHAVVWLMLALPTLLFCLLLLMAVGTWWASR
jgi:hypothetical protein